MTITNNKENQAFSNAVFSIFNSLEFQHAVDGNDCEICIDYQVKLPRIKISFAVNGHDLVYRMWYVSKDMDSSAIAYWKRQNGSVKHYLRTPPKHVLAVLKVFCEGIRIFESGYGKPIRLIGGWYGNKR